MCPEVGACEVSWSFGAVEEVCGGVSGLVAEGAGVRYGGVESVVVALEGFAVPCAQLSECGSCVAAEVLFVFVDRGRGVVEYFVGLVVE